MHWNLHHRVEAARGLDSLEDLYTPGEFVSTLEPGASVTFTATLEPETAAAADALVALRAHETQIVSACGDDAPDWIRRLVLAAEQFIVARDGHSAEAGGATVIAGYPWFGDWGRDTMIALPGLALATGRAPIAAQILRTFAQHINQGLLPNRFPDGGEPPEYNTVDATLWFFVALQHYVDATDDLALGRELLPALTDVIDWHRRGTRHGIVVDGGDGLLRAGEPGVQLTWMDAKVGEWVVTPRTGKPVEINALWCNALAIVATLAERLGDARAARAFAAQAATARESFARRFWNADTGYLYDVIDAPPNDAVDATLRPNQLIALALPHRLLPGARARSVIEACERELLTSVGLRTLAPGSPGYVPRYGGSPRERDGAYHQGTVWPWLLGAFARAHFAVHGDAARALAYLEPLALHLSDAGLGQISEIFDAEPPHAPQGCIAQAWSVAEILATWHALAPAAAATRTTLIPSASPRARRARRVA
jgi:predicted glycogen debranching enzyme